MARSASAARIPRFEFPDGELRAWIALGDVTDRSVRVWVRQPDGATEATLIVGGQALATATIETQPEHDHVGAAVLVVDTPQPSAEFEVVAGDVTRRGRFAPAPGTPTRFSFAFGSCHQPFTEPPDGRLAKHSGAGIYPHIRRLLIEREAAFAMWLGDQVYSDAVSKMSVRGWRRRLPTTLFSRCRRYWC